MLFEADKFISIVMVLLVISFGNGANGAADSIALAAIRVSSGVFEVVILFDKSLPLLSMVNIAIICFCPSAFSCQAFLTESSRFFI